MSTFTDLGRFSKAWWIQLVKNHGKDGGISHLRTKASIADYNKAKAAIDTLVQSNCIALELMRPAVGLFLPPVPFEPSFARAQKEHRVAQDLFQQAMYEILMNRFGAQISAIDVLNHLKAKEAEIYA